MIGRRLTGLSAMALLLAACASMPTSGPIVQGDQIDVAQPDSVVRAIARPPQPGMTPVEIVSGFIQASASFEDDHAVAREYLSPLAAAAWDPGTGTVVYDGVPTLASNGPSGVDMTATQVGAVTSDGRYEVSPPGRVVTDSFVLEYDAAGEWRIADAPTGLLLSRSDVERAFRSYPVFFLDPTFTTLVPDPRLIPLDGPGLSTSLMRALTSGPTQWLAPAVRTALPDGTELAVDAGPVVDGVARVDLDASALIADAATRRALSAQVVWTLRQVPGVRSVDLNAGGQVLPVPGIGNPQPVDAWPAFDPDLMPANTAAYAVIAGRAVVLDAQTPRAVPGAAGLALPPLDGIAVSLDGTRIAGLDTAGALWRGPLAGGQRLVEVIPEPGQSRPSFGGGTSAWTVGPDGIVREVREDGTVVEVPIDGISRRATVESISLSRDGTRAALIVRRGPRTFVMLAVVVLREGAAQLQSPVRVENRLASVIDVAWADSDRLVMLASNGAEEIQAYEIDLTRTTLRPVGAPQLATRIAAAPGYPTLVQGTDGTLYDNAGAGWRAAYRGTSPAYPGG
ncbi:MAG: LpqB family beta-propeller domain-containing protein [bacterium]